MSAAGDMHPRNPVPLLAVRWTARRLHRSGWEGGQGLTPGPFRSRSSCCHSEHARNPVRKWMFSEVAVVTLVGKQHGPLGFRVIGSGRGLDSRPWVAYSVRTVPRGRVKPGSSTTNRCQRRRTSGMSPAATGQWGRCGKPDTLRGDVRGNVRPRRHGGRGPPGLFSYPRIPLSIFLNLCDSPDSATYGQ